MQQQPQYDVKKIVSGKFSNGKVSRRRKCYLNQNQKDFFIKFKKSYLQWKYLLRWENYPSYYNSWVDEEDVFCPDLVEEFVSSAEIICMFLPLRPSSVAAISNEYFNRLHFHIFIFRK